MIRPFTSIALAFAIIAVLTGSTCMACWAPAMSGTPKGCCEKANNTCHKPSKTTGHAHQECSPKPPDLSNLDKPASQLSTIAPPLTAPEPAFVAALTLSRPEWPPSSGDPYYPPDLCLLNSVLTI